MSNYLESVKKQFLYYKRLGEQAMLQIADEDLFGQFNEESNNIAIIVNHLSGNMLSRFSDFLTSDGEKPWRNRDAEFENPFSNREELMAYWQKGWTCVFDAIDRLSEADLEQIVYIRNEGHTVTEALNRQLAHYPYHIGQIVFIARAIKGEDWVSLSIPKKQSGAYNKSKFSKPKGKRHFTDEV